MKQTFCIILTLVSFLSFSQEYFDTDMKREKPKFESYFAKITTLVDSTDGKPYVSYFAVYDKKGYEKFGYELDRNGDTIARIETKYPDKLTEIIIFSYRKAESDTVISKYNKRNQQTVEIWKWGKDKTTDTTKFFYDKKHRLIANFEIDEFGTYQDSLFYNKNKLLASVSYEPERTDSVAYHYKKNKIIEIKKYNSSNELTSDYRIEYGKFNKPKRITKVYKSYNSQTFDRKFITVIEYHNRNQFKSRIITSFVNGKLEETTEMYYSKSGYLKENRTKNSEGKTISAEKTTLHNTVYN